MASKHCAILSTFVYFQEEMSAGIKGPNRFSLAYQNVNEMPQNVMKKYGSTLEELDLAHNNFSYPFYTHMRSGLLKRVGSWSHCGIVQEVPGSIPGVGMDMDWTRE
jgi:hypothetical protein